MKCGVKVYKGFVNDVKVFDYYVIILIEELLIFLSFSDKECKLYDLIVKCFFVVLMLVFEYEEIKVIVDIGGEIFIVKGKIV